MKKKKILFVCASMKVGGAEKSLVNLLNLIDYEKYDIDLLLLKNQGAFLNQIPKTVTQIELKRNAKALYDSTEKSLHTLAMKAIKYITTGFEKIRWKEYDTLRTHRWKYVYSKICEPLDQEYDVVVAYQSGDPTYYAFDKVKAKRKVTFFHTDISHITLDIDDDSSYLEMADLIVTISDKCLESLNNEFPQYNDKMVWLQNLSSSKSIRKLAGDNMPIEYKPYEKQLKIVSVGRLENMKGYDMAINAAHILKNRGVSFQWFIIGEGTERKELEIQIEKEGVQSCFHMIGLRSNPYPYIKFADILVQSSRYEGKSVVLDEAKILDRPIVVTNYNSAKDQISDGVDGLIAKMSGEGIAEKIMEMMNSDLLNKHHTCSDISDQEAAQHYMNVLVGE